MEGFTGSMEMVPLELVIVDHRYQRPEKAALIAAIATDPRWELFGAPILFKREGSNHYYTADGQQRIAGMRASLSPPKEIPAIVFPIHSLADEAAVFVHINEFRKSLTSFEKHQGKIVAKDPATLAIERSVEKAGLSIGAGKAGGEEARTVMAVSTLYTLYNELGEEGLLQVLVVARDAFEDDNGAFGSSMLKLIGDVIIEQNGNYERAKLTRALQRTTVPAVLRKAEALRFDLGGSKRVNMRRAIKELARV